MPRKPKFKPVIKRIRLNPEQAVLSCSCYINSTIGVINGYTWDWMTGYGTHCIAGTRTNAQHPLCASWKPHTTNDGGLQLVLTTAIS